MLPPHKFLKFYLHKTCCGFLATQSCLTSQPHELQHIRHPCSFSISWSLLKLMSIESVMPSNPLINCCPLPFLPSIFPSISVFSNESVLRIRWPKNWSFSFSISPFNKYSRLISCRIDWFDLVVQGTLKSYSTENFRTILILLYIFSYSIFQ